MRLSTALLLSSKVAYSWVMPSRPMERWPAGILRLTRMEEDLEFFGGSRAFPVSREFESLCQTQMELLDDLLALTSATLFFRWENSDTGALEFRPVYVYPGGSVSSDGCGGSLRADTLIPGYPFVSYSDSEEGDWAVGEAGLPGVAGPADDYSFEAAAGEASGGGGGDSGSGGGGGAAGRAMVTADGGLSAPLLYGSVVVGLLVLRRDDGPVPIISGGGAGEPADPGGERGGRAEGGGGWAEAEARVASRVAASLAVAAALDRRSYTDSLGMRLQVGGPLLPSRLPTGLRLCVLPSH